jgi:hypothetical protein
MAHRAERVAGYAFRVKYKRVQRFRDLVISYRLSGSFVQNVHNFFSGDRFLMQITGYPLLDEWPPAWFMGDGS